MTHIKLITVAFVAALSVMVVAQQDPKSCKDATGMANLNVTLLNGTWYELMQAPVSTKGCVVTTIKVANNGTELKLSTLYSSTSSSKLMDKREMSTVNATIANKNEGFNVTTNGNNSPVMTYKILDTDYSSYVAVCGYLASNESIFFGAIFAKTDRANESWVDPIVNKTSKLLLNFNATTIGNITHTGCHANGATTAVPYFTSIFALFLLIAKFLN